MLKVGLFYFALVFAAGFILGPVRILLLEPRVGPRAAELIEAPVMLLVVILAARWIALSWCHGLSLRSRLGVGLIAAGLVLAADLAVGVGLRGMSVTEVFLDRDPVAGPVYYGLVAFAAIAPWMFSRWVIRDTPRTRPDSELQLPEGRE